MWREAAADARQAIRADPCFVKAHLHLGKVLLQQRQLGEAREAVQRGMATLQEAGQTAACARHASPHRMSSRAVKNDAVCQAKSCGSRSRCGKPAGAARQPLSAVAMRCSDLRPNVVRLTSLSWAQGDPFDDG